MTGETEFMTNPAFSRLANAISDEIWNARKNGLGVDECVSVIVVVATDYARAAYGPHYVRGLAELMINHCRNPLPTDIAGGQANG